LMLASQISRLITDTAMISNAAKQSMGICQT
jgi:hypothetical protein